MHAPCNEGTASQLAEKLRLDAVLKGHGFIRAAKSAKNAPALAPEGWFHSISAGVRSFSASSSAGPHPLLEQRGLSALCDADSNSGLPFFPHCNNQLLRSGCFKSKSICTKPVNVFSSPNHPRKQAQNLSFQ
jgi:hypothetical protein